MADFLSLCGLINKLCYEYVLFLPTAARKVRKETPLKGERAYDSVAERFGLKT